MGTCCFTPRKTHFLWWYWLALVALIGLPMLAAVLYVRRRLRLGHDPALVGRSASRLFWGWSLFLVVLYGSAFFYLLPKPEYETAGYYRLPTSFVHPGYLLVLEFFFCFLILTRVLRHEPWTLWGAFVMALGMITWVFFHPLVWLGSPALNDFFALPVDYWLDFYPVSALLGFAACLPAAWGWRRFKRHPTAATSRWALALLVLSALLYQGSARHGNTLHLYAFKMTRGEFPTAQDRADYLMKSGRNGG